MAAMTITKREITEASSPGAHQEWEVVGGRDFFQGDDNQRAAAHDEFAIDLANIVPGLGEVHHQHQHHNRHHHLHVTITINALMSHQCKQYDNEHVTSMNINVSTFYIQPAANLDRIHRCLE